MHPTAALATINDPDYRFSDRVDALVGLAGWLGRGGFYPADFARIDDAAMRAFEEGREDLPDVDPWPYAMSVQDALVNGELASVEALEGGAQ